MRQQAGAILLRKLFALDWLLSVNHRVSPSSIRRSWLATHLPSQEVGASDCSRLIAVTDVWRSSDSRIRNRPLEGLMVG